MIVLKILAIALAFILSSIWLIAIISAGVESGLKRYFESKKD